VLSCVEPVCMAVTNVPLYDPETQAWMEIVKKNMRRPSSALAAAAACHTGMRTCSSRRTGRRTGSSSQSDRRWDRPVLETDDATAMTELARMPTAARTTALAVAACTACHLLMPARTRRSMMRGRRTLSLNVVADCGLTVA
jgi:hypothetical protein